ncbi:unnamed protein product [Pedinophyceae sp. YPF-701]|nr:unnamed protein product [Pedinophyceae sp. YPF-701]
MGRRLSRTKLLALVVVAALGVGALRLRSTRAPASVPKAALVLRANLDQHAEALKALSKSQAPQYVYFSADIDPASGQPWCPDCARSLHAAEEEVVGAGGTLLLVFVGDRDTWRNPKHPLRMDPDLRVTGLPTMMRWGAGGKLGEVGAELEKAGTPEAAREVIRDFIERTKGIEAL